MQWIYGNTANFSQEAYSQTYSDLSPSRKVHIDRFRKEEDRHRSLAGEMLLQKLLKEKFAVTNAVLHRDEKGRPYLSGSDLQVSISHCEEMVVCAVSEEPVGIDVEKIRPIALRAADHVCTEAEREYLFAGAQIPTEKPCEDTEVLKRFFEIWTSKEAWFKKCGTGITDLKSVNILDLEKQMFQIGEYLVQII